MNLLTIGIILTCFIFGCKHKCQSQTLVTTQSELNNAISAAVPGSTIILKNQVWTDVFIDIEKKGTANLPIKIKAETSGDVSFEGNSSVHLGGEYLIFEGVVFKNAQDLIVNNNRIDPIIEFRSKGKDECLNCGVANVKIDQYNGTPEQNEAIFKWVLVYGQHNEISYCSFLGKNGVGSVINDNRNDGGEDYTIIHHNYFADRVPVGDFNALNDQDAIRIGNSATSLSDSFTEVYANYFYNWSGEIEIISNKSGSNKYYANTFRDYQGCLTLRHGDNNEVYGNFFFADNNNTTAGIRVIGENQRIYNNYIESINSRKEGGSLSGATGGINVSNGRLNSALNGYLQVKNTLIVNNTLVNCDYAIRVGTKVSSDLSLAPENLTIANNIILNASSSAISETTSPAGTSIYQGNISQNSNWDITSGTNGNIQVADGLLVQSDIFYRITENSPAIDAGVGSFSFVTEDLIAGIRTAPNDAGAEELASGGNIRPYINADVGVSVGFIEKANDLTIIQNESSSTDLIVKDLIINSGHTLTIAEGHTLTVEGDLNIIGQLVIESGASFINYSINQNDNITIKRSTRYGDGHYSFVGIPIKEQNDLNGAELGAQVYSYDETIRYGNDGIDRWVNALTINLKVGHGYAQAFQKELVFNGTPNNGTIKVSGLSNSSSANDQTENGWNLVSNPYPTAIAVDKFLSANTNIAGGIYLWDDNNSEFSRGDNLDYLTANALGYVKGPNGGIFNGYIGSVQGFFVKLNSPTINGEITFNEDMRVMGHNRSSNFFRNHNKHASIKISVYNEDSSSYDEMIVALREDATIKQDRLYDANKLFNANSLIIFSQIGFEKYAIQGLPMKDGISTLVGYDVKQNMTLTLSIIELTQTNNDHSFYLVDQETKRVYLLNEHTSIPFNAAKGVNMGRFLLSYNKLDLLSKDDRPGIEPSYHFENNVVKISFKKPIELYSILIADLSGRVVYRSNHHNNMDNEFEIPFSQTGIHIIRLETSEGNYQKKIAFH